MKIQANIRIHGHPEDDCYYYIMRQKIEGLPLYYIYGGYIKEAEECYTNIEALYSKDGIQRLSVNKIFDVSHPENIKEVSLMPLENLTEEVNSQYEVLLSNTVYKVNRMELYMMAEQNIQGNYDVFSGLDYVDGTGEWGEQESIAKRY